MDELLHWGSVNDLLMTKNSEVFFVDEKLLMRPDFKVNNKIYIIVVNDNELTSKYLDFCNIFSKSFGTLIVLPKSILPELTNITKKDIESKFNVKF